MGVPGSLLNHTDDT